MANEQPSESAPLLENARRRANEVGEDVGERVSGFWAGFSDFALRDNVLEVAVGLM